MFIRANVFAQSKTGLLAAIIPYAHSQNLDFFFINSVHPLVYFESKKGVSEFFSIITPEQKNAYIKAGYKPRIIDSNAGDIDQYYVLHNRKPYNPNLLKRQVQPEAGLDMIYHVDEYNTLIKVSGDKTLEQLNLGSKNNVYARRLRHDLTPPYNRTTFSKDYNQEPMRYDDREIRMMLFGLLIILVFAVTTYSRNKKARKS